MVDGAVGYHRPQNVRRVKIEKNNSIVRQIEKTKEEAYPDLCKEQEQRAREIIAQKKAFRKEEERARRVEEIQLAREREEKSYDRIMKDEHMTRNTGMLQHVVIVCLYNVMGGVGVRYMKTTGVQRTNNDLVSWSNELRSHSSLLILCLFITTLTHNISLTGTRKIDMNATEDATAAEEFEDDFM